MAVILNPGFELGTGSDATNWTYSETAAFAGSGNSKRGDWSSWLSGLTQTGSYGFVLGKTTGDIGDNFAMNQGDYCQISQSMDMTLLLEFLVNIKWGTVIQTSPDRFQFDIIVDDTSLFSINDTDAQSATVYEDQFIDLSSYTGTHELKFRLTALTTGTLFSPGLFIDNIRETLLPSAPELISPEDEAISQEIPLTFDWEASEGATSYNLQVSLSSNFNEFVLNVTGIASTSYETSSLEQGITYYWRVYGVNEDGTGEASETWSFSMLLETAQAGRRCIVIPNLYGVREDGTLRLQVGDTIGIKLDNEKTHWDLITCIEIISSSYLRICLSAGLPGSASVGNKVFLPSLNKAKWAN